MKAELSLTTDGLELIDYPPATRSHVALAAKAWESFLELPNDNKDLFAATDLQSGVGYERKMSGERESNDIKENFDITAASFLELSSKAVGVTAAESFITAAHSLFDSTTEIITTYGNHVESKYSIEGFAAEAAASAGAAFIRFLYYPPVPNATVIGEPHVDHSGFTFHLYESTGGCDRLSFDGKMWLPMPVEDGKAAVFASMQTQLFSHGRLNGLCHKITANHATSQIGRIAIVCFVPLVNTPAYDRKAYGRLQEMTPGFNYSMASDKFSQLFH